MTLTFCTVRLAVQVLVKQPLTMPPPRPAPVEVIEVMGAVLPRTALPDSVMVPPLNTPPPSPVVGVVVLPAVLPHEPVCPEAQPIVLPFCTTNVPRLLTPPP